MIIADGGFVIKDKDEVNKISSDYGIRIDYIRKDDKIMKKKITGWIIGGLLGVTMLGVTFATNIGSAAEKNMKAMPGMMMEKGHMENMDMHKMMNSPEMQKHCLEMMKSPEMQKSMNTMMKTPEMQAMMKQMLSRDPALRQIMLDLVNSIDPNDQTTMTDNTPKPMPPAMDHNMHH